MDEHEDTLDDETVTRSHQHSFIIKNEFIRLPLDTGVDHEFEEGEQKRAVSILSQSRTV